MIDEVARAHGLDVRIDGVDETGWDFRVHFATDGDGSRWVLREPRRPEVAERIPVEARLLAVLRPRLPVELPEWEITAPDLVAYRRLAGEPLASDDPIAVAMPLITASEGHLVRLGAVIAALHSTPSAEVAPTGIEIAGPEALRTDVADRLAAGVAELAVPERCVDRWRRWLDDDRCWRGEGVPVHHDLSPNHTLVDGSGILTGLLDWADAGVDDPVSDFVAPLAAFGPRALDRLLAAYRAAGGDPERPRREHVAALTTFRRTVSLGLHGLRTGQRRFVDLARGRLTCAGR
ncbi:MULTISPECIES: macrolide 2'-phosphotransferase [unclassified Saccharopolyspora]|uniref:macrolide 2'-phosphotransferase n=1 Tax=unclassified Saccharopolyspora TaxID=2646250 RepID=UPI001CD5BC83|nr:MULTISPECIES: macrolide 2'-phosphotransferase [unclassified Saccharopolyspora]MCA1189300.1 macrolide 2'-phosphotransferase [Saccharopolyspora sp. 6T]MCA1195310.1 macrolide 2'-phosphotransferase [Saccharopolyspora sp. 6V]MCA1282998.1 macrolide 2'-phosphotransferase [Saccharopolyspora sp. 7B]